MAKFLKKQFSTEHSSLNQWRNPECVGEWNHSNNCLSKGWAIPLSPCIHNIFLLPYNTEWKKAKLLEWPDTTSYSFCYSYFLSVSLLTIHTLKAQPLYIYRTDSWLGKSTINHYYMEKNNQIGFLNVSLFIWLLSYTHLPLHTFLHSKAHQLTKHTTI